MRSMRVLRSHRFAVVTALAAVGAPGVWLFARHSSGPDSAIVARVKRGPFVVTVTTAGELRAKKFVQVTAPPQLQQAGVYQIKIASLVPEGTVVKQGEQVAELDRSALASKLADVTLALQKAEAQYEQAQLDSALNLSGARESIRTMELGLEEKKLAKEEAVYEAPTVKRQAEIDYEKAERALAQAKTDYETKTEQARANVGEQRPSTDAKVFEVKVAVAQADTTLRPGMTTGNAIEALKLSDVLFVPLESVSNEDGVPLVYRLSGARATKQEVATGAMNEDEVVVARGLAEGDRVLLTVPPGHDKLKLARLPDAGVAQPASATAGTPPPPRRTPATQD